MTGHWQHIYVTFKTLIPNHVRICNWFCTDYQQNPVSFVIRTKAEGCGVFFRTILNSVTKCQYVKKGNNVTVT